MAVAWSSMLWRVPPRDSVPSTDGRHFSDLKVIRITCRVVKTWICVVHRYTGILFSHTKESGTNVHYNVDEFHRHDAEQKKPDMRRHTVCGSICVKYPEQANPQIQREIGGCQGLGEGEWGVIAQKIQVSFGVMKLFWN